MVDCPRAPGRRGPMGARLAGRVILRSAVRTGRGRSNSFGTATPIDDLGFVALVAAVVGGCQAGGVAHGTVGIDHPAAGSADEMVMVVADAVLIAGRRPGGLYASDDPLVGEGSEGVVHGLERDRTDLGPHGRVDVGGGAVRSLGHSAHNSQTLGGDLHTGPAEESSLVDRFRHRPRRTLALI